MTSQACCLMLMPPGYLLCLQITFHFGGSPWGDGINDVSITSVSLTNILSFLVEKAPWILKIFLIKILPPIKQKKSQITWSCLPYIITHVEDTEAVFTTEMVHTNLLEFSGTLCGFYSEWGQVRHKFWSQNREWSPATGRWKCFWAPEAWEQSCFWRYLKVRPSET